MEGAALMPFPWGAALSAAGQVASADAGAPPPASTAYGGTATGGGITVNYNKGALDWSNPIHVALAAGAVLGALWLLKRNK